MRNFILFLSGLFLGLLPVQVMAEKPVTAITDTAVTISVPVIVANNMAPSKMSGVLISYFNGELSSDNPTKEFEDVLVPIGFFIMIIFVVAIPVFLDYRKKLSLHKVVVSAIEKGADIPMELLNPPKPKRNDLRTGIILLFIGVGLTLFLYLSEGEISEAAPGVIPAFIGLGFLVVAAVQKKSEDPVNDVRNL